jgi:hypothetical protein
MFSVAVFEAGNKKSCFTLLVLIIAGTRHLRRLIFSPTDHCSSMSVCFLDWICPNHTASSTRFLHVDSATSMRNLSIIRHRSGYSKWPDQTHEKKKKKQLLCPFECASIHLIALFHSVDHVQVGAFNNDGLHGFVVFIFDASFYWLLMPVSKCTSHITEVKSLLILAWMSLFDF